MFDVRVLKKPHRVYRKLIPGGKITNNIHSLRTKFMTNSLFHIDLEDYFGGASWFNDPLMAKQLCIFSA